MPVANQFAYGSVTLVIAFSMSFIGVGLGLACTARARLAPSRGRRARWLILGACGIGGAGVWLMQFMAMLGFEVPTRTLRYNVPLTAASMAVSITSIAAGLFIAGWRPPSPARIAYAWLATGVGLTATHYTGVAALDFGGRLSYRLDLLLLSIVVAAATSIGVVWAAASTRRWKGVVAAALGLAAALTATHYAGMAAIQVRLDPDSIAGDPHGVNPMLLMLPVTVITTLALMVLLFGALSMMTDEEFQITEFGARTTSIRTAPPRALTGPPRALTGSSHAFTGASRALVTPVYRHRSAPHSHRLVPHPRGAAPRLPHRRV